MGVQRFINLLVLVLVLSGSFAAIFYLSYKMLH